MSLLFFVYVLLAVAMVGVPALIGFFVDGSETTAWVTSLTAFVIYVVVGYFGRDP